MSWGDDVQDADWRAYAIKNNLPVSDAGEAVEPEPAEPVRSSVGATYGYAGPLPPKVRK